MIPLLIVISVAAFGISHSLLASQSLKQWVRARIGDRAFHGLYRLTYNLVSAVSLAPIMLLVVITPGGPIWNIPDPFSLLLLCIQAVGVIGLVVSVTQIDVLQFAGLAQLRAYLNGAPLPLPTEPLQTGGLYGIVRHPLYLFSLLALWFQPTMSLGMFVFNIGATLYFIIGSLYEERRLTALFGTAYRDYQTRVPWLIPNPRRLRPSTSIEG